ncbi:cell wall protein DAN4-like [Ischnura elegans]|uniref:cell wall protein DAN4-like n=1 Tax=Ischnura elegans TaxID=197161 RepID=UPI001ED8ADDE|nr:cell wall protein DAN4-like [Ischnura elegans]
MEVKSKEHCPFLIFTFLALSTISYTVLPVKGQLCNPEGYACINCTTFQVCISSMAMGPVVTCPAGTICSASVGLECSLGECFECSEKGRFPDPSDPGRYYICLPNPNVPGTFTKIEMTCPNGTQFDPLLPGCAFPVTTTTMATSTTEDQTSTTSMMTTTEDQTSTTSMMTTTETSTTSTTTATTPTTTTTRTTATSTTTPIPTTTIYPCIAEGRFPDVTNCSNYYMCTGDAMGGFYVYKYTCPTTTEFSPIIRKCVLAGLSGCIPVANKRL